VITYQSGGLCDVTSTCWCRSIRSWRWNSFREHCYELRKTNCQQRTSVVVC